jgi:hypothetical protein
MYTDIRIEPMSSILLLFASPTKELKSELLTAVHMYRVSTPCRLVKMCDVSGNIAVSIINADE